jgi:hypothetical protein
MIRTISNFSQLPVPQIPRWGLVRLEDVKKIDLAEISSEPKCMPKPRQSLIRHPGAFFSRPKLLHDSKSIFSHLPVPEKVPEKVQFPPHETLVHETLAFVKVPAPSTKLSCPPISPSVADHHEPVRTSSLSRLKDGKVIGMGNEDAPEECQRQEAVEPLGACIRLGASEADEGHSAQFE